MSEAKRTEPDEIIYEEIEEIHEDGRVTKIDLSPVRAFMRRIEKDPTAIVLYEELELLKGLGDRQKLHIINELIHIVQDYHRKYLHSYTDAHIAHVRNIRALKTQAKEVGEELWPEIPED